MTSLRERIAGERRRLREVRQKLTAAVNQKSSGNPDWIPFYIAAADYVEASMGRMHAQDVKMGDMIREKVETMDDNVVKALAELDERLSENDKRLKRVLAARDRLRRGDTDAIDEFEAAAKDFTDYVIANMGHHGATTELAGRLFSAEDWEYMAGVTDEDMAREVALFERVTETTPADLDLSEVEAA